MADKSALTVGFIGAGKMATAMAAGFVAAGCVESSNIFAFSPTEQSRKKFADAVPGAVCCACNEDVMRKAEVIFLSVKPHILKSGLCTAPPLSDIPSKLFVSIAAGVKIDKIREVLSRLIANADSTARIARVMPNTGALVRASASTVAMGESANEADSQLVVKLFSAIGTVHIVPESMMDACTGLSGSGPAFVAAFLEALSDGGVASGIPRDLSTALALQTVLGATQLMQEKQLHPGLLKDMVCSPGGTTIEGVHALERGGMRSAVMDAVRGAAEKAQKLGQ